MEETETDTRLTEVEDGRVYNYFEENVEAILAANGFKGSVDDYSVIDSEFRRRTRSSLPTYRPAGTGSRNNSTDGIWLDEREGGGEIIEMPNPESGRMSIAIMSSDGKESYVEFFCTLKGDGLSMLLFRRFSEFEKFESDLRKALRADGVSLNIPALPAKQVFSFSGRWKEQKFVDQRRQLLDAWITAIMTIQSKGGANSRAAFKTFILP